MMGIYLLSFIPFVLLESVIGQSPGTPGKPEDVKMKELKTSSVTLTVSKPKDDGGSKIDSYFILMKEDDGEFKEVAELKSYHSDYKIKDLVPGVQFNVKNPAEFNTGKEVMVMCFLSSDTPSSDGAVIEWYDKTGTLIPQRDDNGFPRVDDAGTYKVMVLGPAVEDMAGKYRCKATVNEVVYENTLDIQIKVALTFKNCDENQHGTLGERSVITCSASSSEYITYWSRNPPLPQNHTSSGEYVLGDTSLTILSTKKSDAGTYIYRAISLGAPQTGLKEIKFEVDIPPTILEPVLQTTAVVGKSATLYCRASGSPLPQIEWKKEGSTNILSTTDRIKVNTREEKDYVQGILNFTSVIKEDDAQYTCYAKNRAIDNAAEGSGELVVQIPPVFERVMGAKGIEGGPASLTCVARGDPVPDMVWVNVKTGDRFTEGTSNNGISVTKQVLEQPNNIGANLTLSFNKLQHSDAGQYSCEAKNEAGEAEQIVDLEVQYKPNFSDQGRTEFYNWVGNKDSYLTCTANGNPVPGFKWYKGETEINPGFEYHQVEKSVVDAENPHRATSKLLITFNGNNGDAVFGDYRCEAVNLRGSSEITLSMRKANVPAEPMVDARKEDATHIEFWLYEPAVQGPEVTHFRVVYKEQGSPEEAKKQMVEKEYRDHDDILRKYTVLPVNDLRPSTTYVFTFFAINPVGEGPGREMIRTTKAISNPEIPEIQSQSNSPYPTRIQVQWLVPSDGGSTILEYKLTYQRVTVKTNQTFEGTKGYEVLQKFQDIRTIDKIKDSSYTIENLIPGEYYEIKVLARNAVGYSLPAVKVIRTQEATIAPGASSGQPGGLSTGAIIGIVIGVFFLLFIIVDVTCYFKNNCGILMSIREKVGGGREEGYAVAKTEDVENLAKKDELTEEVKAAEEGELAETQEDEKKEPLLSEEQKVDTVDEGKPEKPELEPEEKEAAKSEQKIESPKTEQAPAESVKEDIPAADEEPPADKQNE